MKGKKILLGITGSIAAYKSAVLVRLLVKAGAEVRVVMTDSAIDFITPLTLATLSKHEVYSKYYNAETGLWHNHVELGLWPDLFLIAPLSANTLSAMAQGRCDNLLLAIYLSARCPVWGAPAMDLDMYAHPAVDSNMEILKKHGVHLIPAAVGELASGLSGQGRMPEPEEIVNHLVDFFQTQQRWKGKKVLITSGPTREAIDPVRFISNHSSGKMGKALAEQCALLGAEVVFITGPTQILPSSPLISIHHVESAEEMALAATEHFPQVDIAILAAAVADYTPTVQESVKIKKAEETLHLALKKTKDIAALLGQSKRKDQLLIGFALETNDELKHATDKLNRKNLDMIVLNSLNDGGAGFGVDTNKTTFIFKGGRIVAQPLITKDETALKIIEAINSDLLN